ncbi:MAG: TetR/AcrR family transcriptional regulator [Sphingobium sp.]
MKTDKALRGALLRLLEKTTFDQITVRMICAEAGVHYATFFRHHATKEALLDHIAADEIEQLVALTVPVFTDDNMEAAYVELCAYVDAHRKLWTALLTGGAGDTMRGALLKSSMRVSAGREPLNDWLPMELVTICTSATHIEAISWWLKQPPGLYPVEQMASIMYRMILGPALKEASTPPAP